MANAEQRGKNEGKIEGKNEGKNEGKVEIAKNLISMNLSLENIAQATGLSIEEIRKLRN